MTTALQIISDAFSRLNRLSPGETLSNDDAVFGLGSLNILVDELSAQPQFLYKTVITSAAQTGNITLGAGSWAAIAPGTNIVSVTVSGLPIDRLSMTQYHAINSPATTGSPSFYAQDGLATVYLHPVPTGQTVSLSTLATASEFADLSTTSYTLPPGYVSALGAKLAVRMAPTILGKLTPELVKDEKRADASIMSYRPPIVGVSSYSKPQGRTSIQTL